MGTEKIRNFCIIAHIDHGKSTLADRILEITNAVDKRVFREQFLDSIDIERERGITIKAKAVSLKYRDYNLNLIDTPGHVDFSYEVSRSLAACEGAILLVDGSQGVQAQTVSNANMAIESTLELIPVINKIDLATARVEETLSEMENTLGIKPEEVLLVSAKEGTGIKQLMEEIIKRCPSPNGDRNFPLQALIFDSVYDEYRGVIVYVRVVNGEIQKGQEIRFIGRDKRYKVEEVGIFKPSMVAVSSLSAGEVGYIIANIKSIQDIRIGDTITTIDSTVSALPGYKEPIPMVFCSFYPTNNSNFSDLKKAIERLSLNDASFRFQPETSSALGYGFRLGFLGLLHLDIIKERLEREGKTEVIQTAPNVTYELVVKEDDRIETILIDNPAKLPEEQYILEWREPVAKINLIIPLDSIGAITKLCEDRRGRYIKTDYISQTRVILHYEIPFAEMLYDFYDKLKSLTKGFGTMDYTVIGYQASDLVKLRILVAGEEVDALSSIVHKSNAEFKGRKIITILRREIPRHLFQIALQASIGKKIVAREDIKPFAKNVTGKCYGGDITRKRKLWEKQREGKKKMKSVGKVDIPQSAFMAVLASKED
jgi:GTP-binding protein LepA